MEYTRHRFWEKDDTPVVPLKSQTLEDVIETWPQGKINVRIGDYMFRPHQKWTITAVPDGGGYLGGPYYKIVIEGTNRALAATADAEVVTVPEFTGAPEQLWRIDQLTDGTYRITLCFVESNPKSPTEELIYNLSGSDTASVPAGVRQFSVAVNGRQLLDNLNLARDYGNLRAVDFSTEVTARNNSGIEVAFTPNIGKTTLSGIRIERIN